MSFSATSKLLGKTNSESNKACTIVNPVPYSFFEFAQCFFWIYKDHKGFAEIFKQGKSDVSDQK